MPWHLKQKGSQVCVVITSTGKEVHCHPNAKKAKSHLAALYANVTEASKSGTKAYSNLHSSISERLSELKGGAGSGNFNHAGRAGKIGGSSAIPSIALEGVDTEENYKNSVEKIKIEAQKKLNEFKEYFPDRLKNAKVPEKPDQQDIEWANNLDLYHTTNSNTVYREGLLPASQTGKTTGSRYYDENLGRLDAVFLSLGRPNTSLDYGSTMFTIKAGKILNKSNALVGRDIGDLPAEDNKPGVSAYKKTLMKGSDALKFFAYERTLSRFDDEILHNRKSKNPWTSEGFYEVMHFGKLSIEEIDRVN